MTQVTMEMISASVDQLVEYAAATEYGYLEKKSALLSLIRQYGEPQWVKVEDALPAKESDEIEVVFGRVRRNVCRATYNANHGFRWDGVTLHDVTHWRELRLPAPPKEE